MINPRRYGRARAIRDGVLFVAGLAGIFYETVFQDADRPTLLLLFAAMVGLPAFLGYDEWGKRGREDNDRETR